MGNLFYDLLIIIVTSLVLTFGYTYLRKFIKTDHLSPTVINILGYSISLVGFFLILLLTFTITNYLNRYNILYNLGLEKSEDLILLVNILKILDNTEPILENIEKYVVYTIDRIDSGKEYIDDIQDQLYNTINLQLLNYVKTYNTPFNDEILLKVKYFDTISTNNTNNANEYLYYMTFFFSILTLIGFLFIGVSDSKIQYIIDFCLISVIIASLYIIYVYSKPFGTTSVRIDSNNYKQILKYIRT